MKRSGIRQKLIDYLQVANDKKIDALYTLLESEIKNTSLTFENLQGKISLNTDLAQVSWSNYITQEEMQHFTEDFALRNKSGCF